jgi:hypothetical protein
MNYYFIVTDTNSRQYVYPIIEPGLVITNGSNSFLITLDDVITADFMIPFIEMLEKGVSFLINSQQVFNSKNLVSVEIKAIPEDAH